MAIKDIWENLVNRVFRRGAMVDQAKEAVAETNEEITAQKAVLRAKRYYKGEHRVPLTDRQEEFLGFDKGGEFAVNFCKTVVNALAERLIVAGFVEEEQADTEPARWVAELLQHNRFDALQMQVHLATVRAGEHFVLVDPNGEDGYPSLVPHPRYTDPAHGGSGFGMRGHYDDDDPTQPMLYASKRWTETVEAENEQGKAVRTKRKRMTLYYPDRVERYVQVRRLGTDAWEEYDEDGAPWPIPWVDKKDGQPLGIPVFHFQNPELESELTDAIPLQDAINKTMLDILAAADATGFPIRFSNYFITTDGKPPASDGSNYVEIAPGSFVTIPKSDAKLENLESGDLTQLLATYGELILTMARVTDTPVARFLQTRQVASEGSQKQMEGPLLAKVRSRQVVFGNAWEDCLLMAAKLAGTFGGQGFDEEVVTETQWQPAETRDEPTVEEKLEAGIPQEQIWSEMGYTQKDIERMKATEEYKARVAQREALVAMSAMGPESG